MCECIIGDVGVDEVEDVEEDVTQQSRPVKEVEAGAESAEP